MAKRRRPRKQWAVSEKLEAVQARLNGLKLEEVSTLYGVSGSTVLKWTRRYEEAGLAGLEDAPRGGRRDASATVEAAEQLLEGIKREDPEAGVGKVQGVLYRRGFLDLARDTVRRLLRRNGHGPILVRSRRHNRPAKVRHFERALPNELWQTDIMSFMIRGQYRVYLIGFMDDHSRFLVGWGLYRFQTAANVQEVFRAAIEKHGLPKEVLSDNGRQYYSWRGRSQFSEMLTKLGIRHIRSRPYHPQTCGKIESFWRNVLQECLAKTPLASFEEAKEKLGEYVEYYNFKRPHQGIDKLMPSDRFYRVADQVRQIVAANTEKVDAAAAPATGYRPPTYMVGNIGGRELRVVSKEAEVTLQAPGEVKSPPGAIPDEPTAESRETSQRAGAVGPDPAGSGAAGSGDEAVRAGGGVAGAVIPVDAGGPGGGAAGAGSEAAGSQAHRAGQSAPGGAEAAGAGGAPGAGEQGAAQGAGPLEAAGGDGQADHPPAGMGPGAAAEA
jgi:transposase InsO family protein